MFKEFKTLIPFARKYASAYLAGLACLLLTDAGELYIPILIKKAIDLINSRHFELSAVGYSMGMMVFIAAGIGLARFGWRYFIIGSSRRIERDLRSGFFSHLLTLSSSYFGSIKTGDVMARATNDMRAIRRASGMALVAFIDGTVLSLAILIILFTRYGTLALITIFPLPFITLIILFAGRLIRTYFKGVQEGFSSLSEGVRETFSGIRVIKSFTKEQHFKDKFHQLNENYKNRNMRLVRLWGFFFPLINFISGLSIMLLLVFGGIAVIHKTITPGDFAALISYLTMLRWPVMGMGFTVNMLQRGAASMARINEILDTKPDIVSTSTPVSHSPGGKLEIKNLQFTFPDTKRKTLSSIQLTVPIGTTLGILGRTGAGKSTLLRLLPRLIDPPVHSIFIDGIDIREYELPLLRSSIGFVPQDTFLFSTTIRENITFGKPGATEEEVDRITKLTTLDRDLQSFPAGWDTEVGERGVTLSGGQKQRIALARALLADTPILILDDAFSAVDTETENNILKGFFQKRKNKINIIVSHRVSTLHHCGAIAVLEKGSIIQQGSHEELMAQDGLYREIAVLQGDAV